MDKRAVSDVVGFVLVFSLITLVVGTVYLSGMGGLEDARRSERLTNAERAFDVLSENVDDVADTAAKSRSTEIKLANANLGFGDPVTFNVTLDSGENYTATTRPIVFTIGDSHVVFSNGAVIREEPGGSAMLSEPSMVAGDRTLIPLLVTRAQGSGIGGSGRVLVRTAEATNDVVRFDEPTGTYNVTMNVTTQRPTAWRNYFEDQFDTDCTITGDTVTCDPFETKRVDLQVVKIDVAIT